MVQVSLNIGIKTMKTLHQFAQWLGFNSMIEVVGVIAVFFALAYLGFGIAEILDNPPV